MLTTPYRPWVPTDPPVAVVVATDKEADPDRRLALATDAPFVEVLDTDPDTGTAYVEDDVYGGWVPVACLYRPVAPDPWPPGVPLGKEPV